MPETPACHTCNPPAVAPKVVHVRIEIPSGFSIMQAHRAAVRFAADRWENVIYEFGGVDYQVAAGDLIDATQRA